MHLTDTPATRSAAGVRCLSLADLVAHFGATEAWWDRRRAELVRHRLLVKRGRRFFGDPAAIAAWLVSQEAA